MAEGMSIAARPAATTTATERNRRHTRDAIVAAAIAHLVRGAEPTMRSVAAEAGVGERTIYRYFPSRGDLEVAVGEVVAPRLSTPLCGSVTGLEDYVDDLFAVFEANQELTVAVVTSSWTQAVLSGTRSRNLADLVRLLSDGFPAAATGDLAAAAASMRTVLSGAGWVYQRLGCGLSADQVATNAKWLVRSLLARLGD